ncbi:dienelactone hydrolase family protein [Gordonia sp. ABSL1-1]|uniref:dienelactone hydrolase family protein n=1 Tax=Gordonia sp. ABSL1-1 TaxID=3053923 RepID=UPI0025726841|nr:dienelactone hydrolase family protein [Gordonia sp. ABSL1-1]MDL9937086.1 dienelactone hydrolase family protein [Gordonia sp. ABSL1-1]
MTAAPQRTYGDDELSDFAVEERTYEGATRRVYRKGTGPAVIVIAEIPGITPRVADFARKVADRGATAVLPSLFGVDGRDPHPRTVGNVRSGKIMLDTIVRACISREFTVLATGRSSPVTTWLRALATEEHERCGGPGVGAVGMCFTGGFALAMAADDRLLAPVLSQPSLPFAALPGRRHAIDIDADDLATVQNRCAAGLQVLGLRFDGDPLSPPGRFEFLSQQLGDAFIGVSLPDSAAHPESMHPKPHSVLTEDLIDEPGQPTHDALTQVLEFFATKLEIPAPPR